MNIQNHLKRINNSIILHFFLAPVNDIINYFLNGAGYNRSYCKLSELVDNFGSRLSGTHTLEHAIGVHFYTITAI